MKYVLLVAAVILFVILTIANVMMYVTTENVIELLFDILASVVGVVLACAVIALFKEYWNG